MRLPTSAEIGRLKRLLDGEQLPGSQLNTVFFEDLLREGYLMVVPKGKNRSVVVAKNKEYLAKHICQQWQIKDLDEYVSFREGPSLTRIEVQNVLGDTKALSVVSYQGFLVTAYDAIDYVLHGQTGHLPLIDGSMLHIFDYEDFSVPQDITVVYVENFTPFRYISRYRHLLQQDTKYLFVSRYGTSSAINDWLKRIPNIFLHFGDFDLDGIRIYQKFYDELGEERASFLVPDDIESRIRTKGNPYLYYSQEKRNENYDVTDKRLSGLVELIRECHAGYEQEGYAI